ncbi:DUF1206 domain-containing protein [Aeromicrobium sp. NPDC092404]|uniref:DUF1206 domain-containing protein n=1 Tax=Aeromicrobium sp. NPDC092404 TaxID=3154976 RepID=UPI00341C675D
MGDVSTAGNEARHSDTMRAAARVGLVAFGLVHLLIAWLALQIAWGGGGGKADSQGALQTVAKEPYGEALLWVVAGGLAALAIWQVMTAIWGHRDESDDKHRTIKRLAAIGRAVVYAVVGFSAARTASGSGGGGKSQDSKGEGLTADLLGAPAGRILVAAVGVAILVIAAKHVHRGITDNFTHDLQGGATSGSTRSPVLLVGRVGYVGKGAAIGVVGLLFGWAAVAYDPEKAGGLDDALKTVRDQPYGPYLLTLVAIGLAAFGLFCFAWARYVRTR